MTTESDRIRAQMAEPFTGGPPAHITPPGVTLDALKKNPQLAMDIGNQAARELGLPEEELAEERAKIARRDLSNEEEAQRLHQIMSEPGARESMTDVDWARRMNLLRDWRDVHPKEASEEQAVSSLATSPTKTGIQRIDDAGTTVMRPSFTGADFPETFPALDNLRPDHPDRMMAQRASEGVDMTSGGPFKTRMLIATSPTQRQQGDELRNFIDTYRDQLPEDLKDSPFMYDQLLQEWLFLQPDKEEPGKWRYTTMEGTGLELGDIGDMMDPEEIFSLSGSVGGVLLTPRGKTKLAGKLFTLGRKGPNARAAATGFVGGLVGRELGWFTEAAITWVRNGTHPTWDEGIDAGIRATALEAFATVAGELGAKILRTASHTIQDFGAKTQGREGVFTDPETVDVANRNIRETQEDMRIMKDVLGHEAMPVTAGTASHSIEVISRENTALANASTKIRDRFKVIEAQGKRSLRRFIEKVWRGNDNVYGTLSRENVIVAANDALGRAGRVSVAQTQDGVVHFSPRGVVGEDGVVRSDVPASFGVHVEPNGPVWKVKTSRLVDEDIDMTDTGIGYELYKSAHDEAKSYGSRLVSDADVSPAAERMWRKLGKEDNITIRQHPDAARDPETGHLLADGPVFEVIQPRSYTESLLDHYTKARTKAGGPRLLPKRDDLGRIKKTEEQAEFSRFLREPGKDELDAIVADTSANPLIKQRFKEAILADYERAVFVKNKRGQTVVDQDLFEEWIGETSGTLRKFFDADDMLTIRRPGGIHAVVERQKAMMDTIGAEINRVIDIDIGAVSLLKEENQRRLWNQVQSLTGKEQRQLFKLLDNVPGVPRGQLGNSVRNIVVEEMEGDLLRMSKGANVEAFNKWIKVVAPENGDGVIRNIWPAEATEWIRNLKVIRNTLQRRTDRRMVVGTGTDMNPAGLALTRVIFGPLSRAQRFFTAARRKQVRGGAAKASELVTDPEALKLFASIRVHRLESSAAARVVQDLGGWDLFPMDIKNWIPGEQSGNKGEEFDANNPAHRKAVADYVMYKLSLEDLDHEGGTANATAIRNP